MDKIRVLYVSQEITPFLPETELSTISRQLPQGIHELPIERMIPGNLTPGGEGQWLLPGPDGSIHILSAAGKPIDHFNHGKPLAGLASTVIDGKPVLIVASSEGVEALAVE